MADWTAVPRDVLHLIWTRLEDDSDYNHFRWACSWWHSAAPPLDQPRLPCLVAHRLDDKGWPTIFRFFGLYSGRPRPLEVPMVAFDALCRGSSHGWLVLVQRSLAILLVSPVSLTYVELPTLFPICGDSRDVSLWMQGCRCPFESPVERKSSVLPFKVVISSDPASTPDFMAVAVVSTQGKLAFWRPGDDAWTLISIQNPGLWSSDMDVSFYKGRLYAASSGTMYACNLGATTAELVKIPIAILPGRGHRGSVKVEASWLVESSGDLLLVDLFYCFGYYFVEVFKLHLGKEVKLLEVWTTRDCALFLGLNHAFSFPASEFPGCEGNSIYLADYFGSPRLACMGVISLIDRSNVFFPINSPSSETRWHPFAWIAPSL